MNEMRPSTLASCVVICKKNPACLVGDIIEGAMILSVNVEEEIKGKRSFWLARRPIDTKHPELRAWKCVLFLNHQPSDLFAGSICRDYNVGDYTEIRVERFIYESAEIELHRDLSHTRVFKRVTK